MNEETSQHTTMTQKTNYLIPLSIVIAGALIAGGLYFSNMGTNSGTNIAPTARPAAQAQPQPEGSLDAMTPITEADHIKGDPNAPIKIVEYSDFECPFCKRFHDTMNQIMDEYGESGQVAWVFRQFPLEQLHPKNAIAEAVASECAAAQGDDKAFWQFADGFMAVTLSNDRTDIATVIPQIVREMGLDEQAFQTCFESGQYDEKITAQIENAVATGGRGTPWSILVAPDGSKFPINGAQPYVAVKQMIDSILSQME